MLENYQIIPDTEDKYSVSNFGNIRNNNTDFTLTPFITDRGYLQVCIKFSSRESRVSTNVHRLVALAFVERDDQRSYVNHKDGDKTNNTASNLEWVTPSENNLHAVELGLIKSGEDAYLAKLTEKEVREILNLLEIGERNISLSRKYNVSPNTIDDIRCNRSWRFIKRQPITQNGAVKKLTGEDIPTIRSMSFKGKSNKEIADLFSVAPATIRSILKGNTWRNY